jgi:hypothetical protein
MVENAGGKPFHDEEVALEDTSSIRRALFG